MRVLLVVPALAAVYGGPSRIARDLAVALGRRGLDVDLVTTNADGCRSIAHPTTQWIQCDHYRVRYFSRWGSNEYKFCPRLTIWLLRRTCRYDLVHVISLFNFPVLATALACQFRKVPYIVNPQGMLEPWALAYKGWKKRIYYNLIERPVILRRARAIHALNVNEATNIGALRMGPPVFVLPNGIDVKETIVNANDGPEPFLERFPAARGKTILLFLHRIDPKKGLDLLARAFALVRPQFPNTHLIIAGPDHVGYTAEVRRFFEETGNVDAVTFTGMLEGEMKHSALAASDIFVLPSYSEGFSMSVLEAMAAGLPCVITTGCNFPEAGIAQVARVTAIDATEFAAALRELLADSTAAEAMGQRAQVFVAENYTWDKIAARFEAIIAELIVNETRSGRRLP